MDGNAHLNSLKPKKTREAPNRLVLLWRMRMREALFYFFNVYLFLREREREHGQGEEQRERETQNPKRAPDSELSAQSPTWGSNPQTMRS